MTTKVSNANHMEQMHKEIVSMFFHGLANPVRLQIVLALIDREKSVSELIEELEMKQSQISNQLTCLKTCGFVSSKKEGKYVYYKVSDPRVQEIIQLVQSIVADNASRINSCTHI